MTKAHDLLQLGQSVWYDNIRRALLDSGELQALLDQGIRGVTSNPSIFDKAIGGSSDYDEQLQELVEQERSLDEIYEALVLDDIRRTADLLRPIYDASGGADGFISLEVSPTLARNTDGTIAEARRFFAVLNRPNVMIKVPATPQGIPAIKQLIGAGINVNVTLMFSLDHYDAVAEAYIAGLETLVDAGGDPGKVASVASFFVSRVDSAVDAALENAGNRDLQGKIGIANSKLAYARFHAVFSGPRWEKLAAHGARVQRVLWASTGVKNPEYPDTMYIDNLIGPDTVNTVPPATLQALFDRATPAVTVDRDVDIAREQIERLRELGIDFDQITGKLQDDGVDAFAASFESLRAAIAAKRDRLLAGAQRYFAHLGAYESAVDDALAEMANENIIARIWKHDHTVWQDTPDEITNRLGWLRIAEAMQENLPRIESLVEAVRNAGYTHALLLGMGGSSLAPEVFRKTFGVADGYLDLAVLDSTDADAVRAYSERFDPAKTLFIVSTKSGGTVETLSFFKHFYNQTLAAVGADDAGGHFIAITDPGSKLSGIAEAHQFRATFINDPNLGGRYSALSYFGLVPAALVGVDVRLLLERSLVDLSNCESCVATGDNSGAWLGAILGDLADAGRDKATFITSPAIASFGDWVEQLIAESTGKSGSGIVPVVGEPLSAPRVYGADRLFVYLHLAGDDTHDAAVAALESAGHPVAHLMLSDRYDLGGQFFLWEMATAVAGHRLGIHPFNQPNVESAKVRAREMVEAYMKSGSLPEQTPALRDNGLAVFGPGVRGADAGEALNRFLSGAQAGDYVTIQAYVQPTPAADEALTAFRRALLAQTGLATTAGYGPRFLHSTGQLHKGDGGSGLFIQITSDPVADVPIPDEAGKPGSSITFAALKLAQALGDQQALLDGGRRVIRFHVGREVVSCVQQLTDALS